MLACGSVAVSSSRPRSRRTSSIAACLASILLIVVVVFLILVINVSAPPMNYNVGLIGHRDNSKRKQINQQFNQDV